MLRGEIRSVKMGSFPGIAASYGMAMILSNPKSPEGGYNTLMAAPVVVRSRKSVGRTSVVVTLEKMGLGREAHTLCHYSTFIDVRAFGDLIAVVEEAVMKDVDQALMIAVGIISEEE